MDDWPPAQPAATPAAVAADAPASVFYSTTGRLYVPYVTPLLPDDPPPTVMDDWSPAQPAATPAAVAADAPTSVFYSTAGHLSTVGPTAMPEEAQPQSPVGLLPSLDTPVRGDVSGAPTSLPPPQQQPWFHRDECPVACALLVGLIVAIVAYMLTDGALALKLSRTGVAALAGIGTAVTLVQLYRNGTDAVTQTARWLITAAIEHALVLSLALCVILVGTHATLLGGRDGGDAICAGPQAHAVGGP